MNNTLLCILSLPIFINNASSCDETSEPLVGMSYFAGWWENLPNKWHDRNGKDWRQDYPDRVPLLGEYNTQETMNKEIIAASEHGVDFFAILWYYQPEGTEREPNANNLERGITNFVNSPEAYRMKFMIEFCNHPPYTVESDADWEACIEKWLVWMKHPSCLRVNDRPVFKVHGFHHFMVQLNMDADKAQNRLQRLRDATRDAGLGKLMLGCGVMGHEAIPDGHPAMKLFDFTGTYMDLPQKEQRPEDYPYTKLNAFAEKAREIHAKDAIPWMPYLPAGWSPRPWPDPRAYFELPNKDAWRSALQSMKTSLSNSSALGLPGQPAFTIYAWNEFGEGGIVAPTHGDGYMKLETIAEVFGK